MYRFRRHKRVLIKRRKTRSIIRRQRRLYPQLRLKTRSQTRPPPTQRKKPTVRSKSIPPIIIPSLIDKQYKPHKQLPPSSNIVAIYNTFNEEDIIESALIDMIRQDVHVHVMDHHSKDGTMKILNQIQQTYPDMVRIQTSQVPPGFNLAALTKEKQQLAQQQYQGWWCLHIDADELRRSPWPELNLRQSLHKVEAEGYNAVNHVLLEFKPETTPLISGGDLLGHFHQCYFRNLDRKLNQIKTWKQGSREVNLSQIGEQSVKFVGRKVYPQSFLLLHFPFRTFEQAAKKIFKERKPVFNKKEKLHGMHSQYNKYKTTADIHRYIDSQPSKHYTNQNVFQEYITLSRQ